uniref:Uncharacterized protein n=1 Tax=Cacopsylla melanoneura TaxID=428564 RepID=A0A8D9AJS5_9HEMI
MDCSEVGPIPVSGDVEPNILDFYEDLLQREAAEDNDFLNNQYYTRQQHNGSLFRDNAESVTFAVINNRLFYNQYINQQKSRQIAIQAGKMKVNYNQEFSNRYVPGKRSTVCPKTSCLSRQQMNAAFYHFTQHKTHKEAFQSQVLQENEEFQAYIQQLWRTHNYKRATELDPHVKSIIDEYWQARISECKSIYPSVYRSIRSVPLTLESEESAQIHLAHVSVLHSEGSYHQIRQPITIKQEHRLTTDSKEFNSWLQFIHKDTNGAEEQSSFSLTQDSIATNLALNHNCSVVMTTSSVKTLLNNHSANHYARSWMLPVHVKMVKDPNTGLDKKIIYLDKKLTHKSLTQSQKLAWFTKLAVKKFAFDYTQRQRENEREEDRGPGRRDRRGGRKNRDWDKSTDTINTNQTENIGESGYSRNQSKTRDTSQGPIHSQSKTSPVKSQSNRCESSKTPYENNRRQSTNCDTRAENRHQSTNCDTRAEYESHNSQRGRQHRSNTFKEVEPDTIVDQTEQIEAELNDVRLDSDDGVAHKLNESLSEMDSEEESGLIIDFPLDDPSASPSNPHHTNYTLPGQQSPKPTRADSQTSAQQRAMSTTRGYSPKPSDHQMRSSGMNSPKPPDMNLPNPSSGMNSEKSSGMTSPNPFSVMNSPKPLGMTSPLHVDCIMPTQSTTSFKPTTTTNVPKSYTSPSPNPYSFSNPLGPNPHQTPNPYSSNPLGLNTHQSSSPLSP